MSERERFEAWWNAKQDAHWRRTLCADEIGRPRPERWGGAYKRDAWEAWSARAELGGDTKPEQVFVHGLSTHADHGAVEIVKGESPAPASRMIPPPNYHRDDCLASVVGGACNGAEPCPRSAEQPEAKP